ncbi:17711_t:CDS:2, partial [Cetraspora pellucida]
MEDNHESKNESFAFFLLFSIKVHSIIAAKFSNLSSKEISNIILKLWSCLPEISKTEYKIKISGHTYFGITCHWITYDFKLIEVVLEVMNFSGSELFEKLQLSKFRLAHENIVSITVNNEDNDNVKTALSQMQFEIIPCLPNILRISPSIQYLYETLNNNILGISREEETLKENILSDDEFDICRELDIILKLFYELTEMLEGSKYPALSVVTPAIKNLKQRLSIYQLRNDVIQQIINNILDKLRKNCDVPSTLGLYRSFFDHYFKNLLYANEELCHTIINNLRKQYTKLTNLTFNSIIAIKKEDSKMLQFFQTFDEENYRQTEFDKYLELIQLPVMEENNSLRWWSQNKYLFATLAKLARKYLSIPAFSAPNRGNGVNVFISSGYSPILLRNSENVISKNMIKELPGLNIKIPAFILNTAANTSYNEKTYNHLSNHQVSSLIGYLWSKLTSELREEYQQQAKKIKLDYQKQNKGKYTYKKRSSNKKTRDVSKKKKLTQVSNTKEISLSSSTENNEELLTDNLEKIFNFPLDRFISKELSKKNMNNIKKNYYEDLSERNNVKNTHSEELSEINNAQETYSEKSNEINNFQKSYSEENNDNALFDYQQLFSFLSEYDIFGLDTSNQLPLTGIDGWQSTEKLENPSTIIYREQSTEKLENPSELIYDERSTVDHSVYSIENIESRLETAGNMP